MHFLFLLQKKSEPVSTAMQHCLVTYVTRLQLNIIHNFIVFQDDIGASIHVVVLLIWDVGTTWQAPRLQWTY